MDDSMPKLENPKRQFATVLPITPPANAMPFNARPNVLEVEQVWKIFGSDAQQFKGLDLEQRTPEEFARRSWVPAVRNASFNVGKGEVFVIMGLSGSGKSTLVRCLTRLVEPTAGAIKLDGENLLEVSEKRLVDIRRTQFGMVFQHFALLPNRTVLGNILFPLEVQGVEKSKAEARAKELISMVGLEGKERRFPTELSGGQQQRIGIARSLATDPAIWFLDEPFSALDPLIRADLQDELIRLQATLAKTIVFITHDLDEAIRIADRVAIMENGHIVQIGTAEQLVTKPATDYVRRFVSKVSPAKVTKVSSLMQPGSGSGLTIDPVLASSTIADIGPILVRGAGPISVINSEGNSIGTLDRALALQVLAGRNILSEKN
jgi:glycine betaine/proline transport system ATP-binding protein